LGRIPFFNRENLILLLEVAKTLLRDLVMMKTLKNKSKLIHSDLLREMESLATGGTFLPFEPDGGSPSTTLAIRSNATCHWHGGDDALLG